MFPTIADQLSTFQLVFWLFIVGDKLQVLEGFYTVTLISTTLHKFYISFKLKNTEKH